MAILTSDGLSLSVGDGAGTETFTMLRGVQITRFDLTQKLNDNDAVASDAWGVGAAVTNRRVILSCEGLMTDETALRRIRAVALGGLPANFKLALGAGETLGLSAYVTGYRETIQPGAVKKFSFEVESSGAVTIAA